MSISRIYAMKSIREYMKCVREILGSPADKSHPQAEGRTPSPDSLPGGEAPSDTALQDGLPETLPCRMARPAARGDPASQRSEPRLLSGSRQPLLPLARKGHRVIPPCCDSVVLPVTINLAWQLAPHDTCTHSPEMTPWPARLLPALDAFLKHAFYYLIFGFIVLLFEFTYM